MKIEEVVAHMEMAHGGGYAELCPVCVEGLHVWVDRTRIPTGRSVRPLRCYGGGKHRRNNRNGGDV